MDRTPPVTLVVVVGVGVGRAYSARSPRSVVEVPGHPESLFSAGFVCIE